MATGAARRLAIIAEASFGAGAGAAPAFDTALVRSGGPKLDTDTLEDDSIRADFQRQGVRLGSRKGSFALSTWLRYGAYYAWLEALLGGTWTANVLGTGTTRRSFAFEEYFGDLGAADDPYHRWDGCEFSKLALQVQNNQLVSANFDGLCRNLTGRYDAAIANSTYAAPSTNPPFAFKDAAFTVGGSSLGIITSLSLAIDRQLQPRYVANSAISLRPDSKIIKVNGNVEIWLDTGAGALMDDYLAETQRALTITLTDPLTNSLLITVPAFRFTSGVPNVPGDGSIPVAMAFEAYFDSVSSSQLTLTRTPHV